MDCVYQGGESHLPVSDLGGSGKGIFDVVMFVTDNLIVTGPVDQLYFLYSGVGGGEAVAGQ